MATLGIQSGLVVTDWAALQLVVPDCPGSVILDQPRRQLRTVDECYGSGIKRLVGGTIGTDGAAALARVRLVGR